MHCFRTWPKPSITYWQLSLLKSHVKTPDKVPEQAVFPSWASNKKRQERKTLNLEVLLAFHPSFITQRRSFMPKQLNFTSRPLLRGRAKTDKPISYRGGEILDLPKKEAGSSWRGKADETPESWGFIAVQRPGPNWCLGSSCQHSSLNFHKPILTIFSAIFGLVSLSANETSVPRTPDLEHWLNMVSLRDPSEFGTSLETSEPVLAHGAYMGWWMLL